MGGVFFKENPAMQYFKATLNIFQAQSGSAFIHPFEVGLGDAFSVVVHPYIKLISIGVLGEMDKAGVTVFEDIVDQFLDYPEDDQFVICLKPLLIVVKPAAGIDDAGAADLLKLIIHGRFKTKVFRVGGIKLWEIFRISWMVSSMICLAL